MNPIRAAETHRVNCYCARVTTQGLPWLCGFVGGGLGSAHAALLTQELPV